MSQLPRRILVVDDDPNMLRIVSMYLGIEGYDVVTASTGEAGLAELRARQPQLVIMDVMMPGMDGVETCRRIRADPLTSTVPVLMLTALSGEDAAERARRAGATRFLPKPFNLVGLKSAVEALID